MLKSSPLELLAFQTLSRKFRRILADNPRCWNEARNNMDPPVPPPPHVDAAGVWSESAYAQFIFGGGECIVGTFNTSAPVRNMIVCRLKAVGVGLLDFLAPLPCECVFAL
jgi:hypothetical protein